MHNLNENNRETVSEDIAIKEALFNANIPFVVCRLSPFRIIHASKVLQNEWGFFADTLCNEPERITEVIYKEDRPEFIKKVIQAPLHHCYMPIEFRITLPGNQKRWYALRLYPLRLEDATNHIAGFIEDITERKSSRKLFQTTYQKLEDYFNMIRHDVKGVLGSVELVIRQIKQKIDPQEQQELSSYFELITEICRETVYYTNDLSNEFLMDAEDLLVDEEETDIVETVFEVIDMYRAQLEDKKIKTKVEVPEGKILAMVDRMKFRQIIKNLLSNAIKFSHDEGHITITVKNIKKAILLMVKDKGIGIPEASQPYIFEKYSKAIREGTKGEKPTGLGTYIIKRMVDIHKGKVWFESEEEVGTTFYVKVPKQPH